LGEVTLKPGCECPSLPVPELRPHVLEFIQRAGAFVPTPATRKVLANVEAEGFHSRDQDDG
jgi:hypothetical protein